MDFLRRLAAAAVTLTLAATVAACDPEGGGLGGLPPCKSNCKTLLVTILGDGADRANITVVITDITSKRKRNDSPKGPRKLPHYGAVSYTRDGTYQVQVEARPVDEGRVKIQFRTKAGGNDLCGIGFSRHAVCIHLTPR